MPELIKHRETGFLVEGEEEMVEMIDRLQTLDRASCRTWVAEHFSVAQMVDCYEQLYRRAASGRWSGEVAQKQGHAE
jgi:glycosyltransferase involved in cell wall biosynthesis